MKRLLVLSALALAAACLAQTPGATAGQNVTGTVMNATTGKPLAHSPVTIILLQGAMKPLANTTTDAQGHYRFSESTPGPFMIEADFDGVPYFAQVAAGQTETNLQVYAVNHDPNQVVVDAEIMVLQPDAGQLAVVNEYRVENGLKPPQTLARKSGKEPMFRFRVPSGAHVDMVRVVGPGEMPLSLDAQPTAEHDVYGAATPLRPGETRVQVSYRVPYAKLQAALAETPVIHPNHFEVYVPNPMTFQGAGFVQVGSQDGYKVYGTSEPVAATVKFQISGDAPMPAMASNDPSGSSSPSSSGAQAQEGSSTAPTLPPNATTSAPTPTFLERNLWTLLGLLALAAAAGFGILLAQPKTPDTPDAARLKDDLFQLELARHTGAIEESDYARKRTQLNARLDQYANPERAILETGAARPEGPPASN